RHHPPAARGDERRGLEASRVAHRDGALHRGEVARHLLRARPQPRRPDPPAARGAQEVARLPGARPVLWRCRDHAFDLTERTLVMGVVNVTPDSFSDGGRFLDPDAAAARARALGAEGADLVDLGAESTRPGAPPVPAAEQLRRLLPVLEALRSGGAPPISVDTASAEAAARALEAGAVAVNDVTALGDPALAATVAASGAGLVLMHMRGAPADMQRDPRYGD